MRQLKITKSITNRDTASLDKYLQDIGKEGLITADEEVELARKIRAGDQKALDKLCRANLRFVVSVAKLVFVVAKLALVVAKLVLVVAKLVFVVLI